jgi:hypothetical protein
MQPLDKIDKPELLWVYSYCDRALSGLAMYQNKFVWFKHSDEIQVFISTNEYEQLTEDEKDCWYDRDGRCYKYEHFYNFYQISNDEFKRITIEHKIFEHQVGKHTNHYDGTYERFNKDINTIIVNGLPASSPPVLGNLIANFNKNHIISNYGVGKGSKL